MTKLKIAALLASFFSVIFSMSIVLELRNDIDVKTFLLISVFIGFILLTNEYLKIKNLHAKFDKKNYSNLIIVISFTLSLSLSSIGAYFWVMSNKTMENDQAVAQETEKLDLISQYATKIDSVRNLPNEHTDYALLTEQLQFWKNRICRTNEEREQARNNVVLVEQKIEALKQKNESQIKAKITTLEQLRDMELNVLAKQHESAKKTQNEHFFILCTLITLIVVTEFLIVYIQYSIANFYSKEQKQQLRTLHQLVNQNNDRLSVDDIRFCGIMNPNHSKDETILNKARNLYFLLGNLGVIDKNPKAKGAFIDKEQATKLLQNYFNKINAL